LIASLFCGFVQPGAVRFSVKIATRHAVFLIGRHLRLLKKDGYIGLTHMGSTLRK